MGMIGRLFSALFGGGIAAISGGVREVAAIFTPNAEAEAQREHAEYAAALAQYAREFRGQPGVLNQLVDFINRLPRPAMAMGTLYLFVEALRDPLGFAESMQGLQAVPEPLWWLLGAIVSFYFGARELQKFREARPPSAAEARAIVDSIRAIRSLRSAGTQPGPATPAPATPAPATPARDGRAPAPAAAPAAAADPVNPAIAEFLSARG
ncbi:MAG: hypothetical protein KatS3mg118_2760 [Paracoccaceae bacterium]|nr:MAG: hypothetical protein KatS3mg118_2760 [Paracoccaceae bacterium]